MSITIQRIATIASLIFIFISSGFSQLSGSYTIDSALVTSGTNYQTFTAAISALNSSGVSGAVTFNVKKGTYAEQISFTTISGASSTKTITFKGLGDITSLSATPPTTKYPIVGFNGTSHVIIDSLKIQVNGARGWGVHFMNVSDSISIKNCHIVAPILSTCYGIVASSSITSQTISANGNNGGEYITIQNNTIEGGNSGIFFKGTTGPLTSPSKKVNYGTDLNFEGNEVINFRATGIDISYNHNVNIIGNTVSSSETTAGGALRFWDAGDNCNIIGNSFYISSNTANSRVVALSMAPANGPAGVSTLPITIANNFIHYNGTNSSAPTGLLLKNKAYIKVYHNTIRIKNQGTAANCIWFDANNVRSLNGIEVRNNVLALENSGSGRYFHNAANGAAFKTMIIDHNNFYAPSSYFSMTVPNGTSGTSTYTSLTAYKASSYGTGALNVNPVFFSATNLHATSAAMNDSGAVISSITDDIDGEIRSTTAPDMGADEYTPGQIVCYGPTQVYNECDSFSITIGSNTYTTPGVYTDTLVGSFNCDSAVVSDIRLGYTKTAIDTQTACGYFTWTNGMTYTASNNTDKDTLLSSTGCDSIITLNLTIRPNSFYTDTVVACDSYTWRNGVQYTSSNTTAADTLKNSIGCDSIITLNLTLNKSNIAADIQTACDTFTWINSTVYTTSNRGDSYKLINAAGCDSVVYLDLTVNYSSSATDVHSACATFNWIDGNTYTADNNTATHTIINSKGCDSVVTLDLTIKPVLSGSDVQTACDEYTWINGKTYTSNNYIDQDTLTSAQGCDSIITLLLTIINLDTTTSTSGFTISATQTNATYEWLDCENDTIISGETSKDFTASRNGSYSVIVTQNNCTDTSDCVDITGVGFNELKLNSPISVFPNPNNGTFRIDLGTGNDISSIEILNMAGQVIYESIVDQTEIEINLQQPQGVYLLRLSNEMGTVTQRLVIE
ncbi:MAG: T9SS type A sorting domain-containing protein [Salibacteraceae bacterium]